MSGTQKHSDRFIYIFYLIRIQKRWCYMAEESAFRGMIGFLDKLGVYDVILPFLLIFTIVFAVLEKTKILGVTKIGSEELTKKNLNSMVAVITAFIVVASTQLVSVINEVMANVVLLLILSLCFLMLVGVFFTDKQFSLEDFPGWIKFMMVLMFVGVVAIFLNALDWLQIFLAPIAYWNADWAVAIVFIVVVIGFMVFITWEPKQGSHKKKD